MLRKHHHTCQPRQSVQRPPYRIAYIVDQLVGPTAGTENQLLALINGLGGTYFDPYLVALRSSSYLESGRVTCPIHVLDVPKLIDPKAIKRGWELCSYLRQKGISLVHIYFNDSSIYAPIFCKLAGSKVILSRRDLGFNFTPGQLFLLKLNRLFIDRIIVNSEAVKKVVCTKERWAPFSKVKVIYNGVDFNRFESTASYQIRENLNIPPEAPIVGMVANLNPWKRHKDLIEAFGIILKRKPDSRLVLVGDGMMRVALERKVKNMGLQNAVHFSGRMQDVFPAVKEFSIGVLSSETEGFSNALIEYMACGLPVVATRTGGNVEAVEDGRTGFLVPVGDPNALAERVLDLLEDPGKSHRFGRFGRLSVERNFSLNGMIEAHLRVYRDLLDIGFRYSGIFSEREV